MSALGQKRTYALQQAMSALHPIATTKADTCQWPCLLYPRKRTVAVQLAMSALAQKGAHALHRRTSLFDHLIGSRKQFVGDGEAERLGGLEIDDQLILGRHLHGEIGRLFPLEDAVDNLFR